MKNTDNEFDYFDLLLNHGIDVINKYLFPILENTDSDNKGEIEISDIFVQRLIKYLTILDRDRHGIPITLFLSTCGGDVSSGFALYDFIKKCRSEIHIIVLGKAYSMGSIILQSADRRIMSENSSIMIHDGTVGVDLEAKAGERFTEFNKQQRYTSYKIFQDKMKDVRRNARLPQKIKDIMERGRIPLKGKGFTINEIETLLSSDLYLNAKEALKLNLIDEII